MGNQFLTFGLQFLNDAGLFVASSNNYPPIPGCWDEMLDWTEEASLIFQLYLFRNSKATDNNEEELGEQIQFVPYIRREKSATVNNISSMTYAKRTEFFAEHVFIAVSPKKDKEKMLKIITVESFYNLMAILFRYYDMLVVLKSKIPEGTRQNECSICLEDDDNQKMVVMSCSHHICVKCFDIWVSKKLKCPYCRHEFQRCNVQQNPWEMIKFDGSDLVSDMETLESRLADFWKETLTTAIESSSSPDLLTTYVMKERVIRIREEGGNIIIDK